MTQLETIHGRGATHLSAPQKVLAVLLSIVLAVGLSPLGQAPAKAYAEGGDLQAASVDDGLQAQTIPPDSVAKIGDQGYASLRAAVTAANADASSEEVTIELLANDTVSFAKADDCSVVIDRKLTIDGKGFTVSGLEDLNIKNVTNAVTVESDTDEPFDGENGKNSHGLFIKSGDVTIKNLTMTKFGNKNYCNKFGIVPIMTATSYTGKLTITDVNINKFNRQAICVWGGNLTISGGDIVGNAEGKDITSHDYFQQPIEIRGDTTATIDGVTITGGGSTVKDTSGDIYPGGAIVAWGKTQITNANINFDGIGIWSDAAAVTLTGEDTSVKATKKAVFVEDHGAVYVQDGSYEGELATATDGDSIVVSGGTFDTDVAEYCATNYTTYETSADVFEVDETIQAKIDKSTSVVVKATLAGNTSQAVQIPGTTGTAKRLELDLNGKTLANNGAYSPITVASGGELAVKGPGTVDSTADGMPALSNHGTAELNGGSFTRSKETYVSETNKNVGITVVNEGTMTIADGVTVSKKYPMYSTVQNNGAGAKLTVDGGAFSGGAVAVDNAAGEVVVNGGSFSATAAFSNAASQTLTIKGGSTTATTLLSIAADNTPGTVAFSGGDWSSATTLVDKTVAAGNGLTITGGTYGADPTTYVPAEGYRIVSSGGKYTVVEAAAGTYALAAVPTNYGTISFKVNGTAGTSAKKDDKVTFVESPIEGYELYQVVAKYKINNVEQTRTIAAGGTFTMVEADVTFTPEFKLKTKNISDATVTVTDKTYTGSALYPDVTVTLGGVTLAVGTDYTVSYRTASGAAIASPTNAGTYTVVVSGVSPYTGTKTATYKIEPKSLSGATLALTPTSAAYNAAAQTPTVAVKDGSKTLVSGTDYTVSYKSGTTAVTTMVDAGAYTVTITGTGNYKDAKTATFTINKAALSTATITASPATFTFNGSVQGPKAATVKFGTAAVPEAEYAVTPSATSAVVGDYKATVAAATAAKNVTGTATADYKIAAFDLTGATVTLSSTEFDYDGQPHKPTVALIASDGVALPVTYVAVSYQDENSTAAGTYTVSLLPAANQTANVIGTKTVSYEIIDREKQKADEEAAEAAEKVIDEIVVSETAIDAASIAAARAAYDTLTADQKALVPATELAKLSNAEAALANPADGMVISGVVAGPVTVAVTVDSAKDQTVELTSGAPVASGKLVINTVEFGGKTYKVTAVAKGALKGSASKGITKITVGANVKKVGGSAFSGAPDLKTLVIGKGATLVGKNAAYGAKNLAVLTLGKSVKTVKAGAFKGTKVTVVKLKSANLTKKSCKNLVKGTKIKTVKLYGAAKTKKDTYKKWFGALGVKVK